MLTVTTIALLGAAQGMMMSLAILAIDRGNLIPNRLLATFIMILSIRLFAIALEYSGSYAYSNMHALLHLSYTIGPLIYFYLCALVKPHWNFSLVSLLHFSPAVLAVFIFTPEGPIFDLKLNDYVGQGFENLPHKLKMRAAIASMPVYVSLIVYSVLSLRVLEHYRKIARDHFSSPRQVNLRWAKSLVYFCLAIGLVGLMAQIYRVTSGNVDSPRAIHSVLVSVILIYYMGLMGIRQPQIFAYGESGSLSLHVEAGMRESETGIPESEEKYQRSGLTDDHIDSLWTKLEQLMRERRPYLLPSLKLADLANMVGTRPNYLSQVINSKTHQSFYDYINHHRVNQAMSLLCDGKGASVANIALDVGYNSPSVLNRHFKSQTGLTPTQYRKEKGRKAADQAS